MPNQSDQYARAIAEHEEVARRDAFQEVEEWLLSRDEHNLLREFRRDFDRVPSSHVCDRRNDECPECGSRQ